MTGPRSSLEQAVGPALRLEPHISWFVRTVKIVAVTVGGAAAAWYAWQRWQEYQDQAAPRRGPRPRHTPEPEAEPEPEPEPEEAVEVVEVEPSPEPMTVKGVSISDPAATVAFANEASDDDLAAAGLSAAQRAKVVAARPFADVQALGSTKGIGPKTLSALSRD